MAFYFFLTTNPDLSVPSPLVGEGQGGGCPTARPIGSIKISFTPTAFAPGVPPSPALPHKGGGSRLSLPQQRRLLAGDFEAGAKPRSEAPFP
jgi:hypothetical protein